MDEEKETEPEDDLCCDSCGGEIFEDDLFWTDSKGSTLCEECIPPGAVPIGVRH